MIRKFYITFFYYSYMPKIIFVKAPVTMEDLYGDLADAGNALPPFGLAVIAAVTRENGYETKILDCTALNYNYDQALGYIKKENPDYVGFTASTIYINQTAKLAEMIKRWNKNVVIVLGGPHITGAPAETLKKFQCFDFGLLNEAEETLIELLDALEKKKSVGRIKGLAYKDKVNEKRPLLKDLDALPLPAWDLLPDITKYYQPPADGVYRLPSTVLVTSRGCPMRCIFCANSIYGKTARAHSAEYVLKMVKQLYYDFGIREIQIYEDNFVIWKDRVKKICELLIKENMDLNWCCMASVNWVDEEMLKLMKKAGCWQIAYGIESGSQRMLDFYRKGTNIEMIKNAVKWTNEAGIRTKGFFILGGPTETIDDIEETIKLIKELPMTDFHITYFTPIPGSQIYKEADRYGNFVKEWDKLGMFKPSFIPKGLTEDKLFYYYKKAYRIFYLRPRIIYYFLKKFRTPKISYRLVKSGIGFMKFLIKPRVA